MGTHVPQSISSSLFVLTAVPVALVGLATGLAVGTSTAAVLAVTAACLGLGLLSFLAALSRGEERNLRERVRTAGFVLLPGELVLAVVLAGTFGRPAGFLFGAVASVLALYQIAGFQLLDRLLYRRYGDCVGLPVTRS